MKVKSHENPSLLWRANIQWDRGSRDLHIPTPFTLYKQLSEMKP